MRKRIDERNGGARVISKGDAGERQRDIQESQRLPERLRGRDRLAINVRLQTTPHVFSGAQQETVLHKRGCPTVGRNDQIGGGKFFRPGIFAEASGERLLNRWPIKYLAN